MASLLHRPERVAVGRLVTRDSPSAGRKSGETGRAAATGPDPTGRMPSLPISVRDRTYSAPADGRWWGYAAA